MIKTMSMPEGCLASRPIWQTWCNYQTTYHNSQQVFMKDSIYNTLSLHIRILRNYDVEQNELRTSSKARA